MSTIEQAPFAFQLGQWVRTGDTRGQVRARRDGIGYPNEYQVAINGTQTWWAEVELRPSQPPFDQKAYRQRRLEQLRAQRPINPDSHPKTPQPAAASVNAS